MADIMTKDELYYPGAGIQSDDFIGFSFNGVTSKSLGISRVSDGSRYNEQMLPGFQDKSAQMPGSDYTLYWESFYNTRTWTLNIAFDHMTDKNMHDFRHIFDTKNLGELKFAERTYEDENENIHQIHWLAKVQSPPQLKYICFDEDGKRIYKGEGTITFIAYYPFGMSELNSINFTQNSVEVKNLGEIPMEWELFIPVPVTSSASLINVVAYNILNATVEGELQFSNFDPHFKTKDITRNNSKTYYTLNNGEYSIYNDDFQSDGIYYECPTYVGINSKTNLVEGYVGNDLNSLQPMGHIYNEYITAGDFFKIPIYTSETSGGVWKFSAKSGSTLRYYYLYL